MGRLDEIQARADARMAEIEARLAGEGKASPRADAGTPEPRFDVSDVVRSFRSEGAPRGGCRKAGLCVGLKNVDPAAYGGVPQPCPGCDLDAADFANVLTAAGIRTTLLSDSDATKAGVVGAMRDAAASLGAGDLFVMSVAGHGARGAEGGWKGAEVHESWCLWDGQLLDSEIVAVVRGFAPGVRIVMINDQCHSGGIFREYPGNCAEVGVLRSLSGSGSSLPMLIQFAACRAEEASIGYPIGGTWTTALLKVLAVDRKISWRDWFEKAKAHPSLTERQQPQWFEVGPVTDGFRSGEVFV